MFVGHFGMALAAKKLAPRASLAVLILAAQLADVKFWGQSVGKAAVDLSLAFAGTGACSLSVRVCF